MAMGQFKKVTWKIASRGDQCSVGFDFKTLNPQMGWKTRYQF